MQAKAAVSGHQDSLVGAHQVKTSLVSGSSDSQPEELFYPHPSWQCLGSILVVPTVAGGGDATSLLWVEARGIPIHYTIDKTAPFFPHNPMCQQC